MTTETLGQAIRRLRLASDFKLREFAALIPVTAAYLSDIEYDRRIPTEEKLAKIAKLLSSRVDITYEELRSLSPRLESDLQRMVQQNPEVGQLLRKVKQTGRPAHDVIRELQEHLRKMHDEANEQ